MAVSDISNLEVVMLKIEDLNLTIERPRVNGSKLKDRVFFSDGERLNKVEECIHYTYFTAIVSRALASICT